ncbi:MAG: cysteine--tRNA ligase [Fimbriiglobus sp.]
MPLQVFSTLSRKKEPFGKAPGEPVTMYVCGPTVYKPSHIGHMVGPVIFDAVKRYLTYLGYPVQWVVNITDVDDKLIERAGALKTTVPELAEKMTADYKACLTALNVTGIDAFPKATEHIGGMIEVMESLISQGYAYAAEGDVYFEVGKDQDYGKLCGFDPEALEQGAEKGTKKRNPGDFALWKSAKPHEPKEVQYESPFGPGRPGWHIECTCMAIKMLGETLDIHGGGRDLRFPHHENELAQSESWTGKPFARLWMHNGLMELRDKEGNPAKMAGSLGNVLNVADALKHMTGDALRFFMLSTHYRSPIDLGIWDWLNPETPIPNNILESNRAYENFLRFVERYELVTKTKFTDLTAPTTTGPRELSKPLAEFLTRFRDHMDDDFNTGGGVGVLFELQTYLNRLVDTKKLEDPATSDPVSRAEFLAGAAVMKEITQILGLTFIRPEVQLGGGELVAGLMQLVLDLRANLRNLAKPLAKDDPVKKPLFEQTDLIRERLGKLKITLEDRPGGTTWKTT